jgi:hypothetical protein
MDNMTNDTAQISSNPTGLLEEARGLIERSRTQMAEMPQTINTQDKKETVTTMSIEVTPQRAGELYTSGMSVIEVARETNITYSKARKLIRDNGTEIRDGSARLKGKTRPARPASSTSTSTESRF